MKDHTKTKIVLAIAGLVLLLVGVGILVLPHAFYESNGILLGSKPGLLSEIRASGGLLLASGLFLAYSLFRPQLHQSALMLAGLVYLSYGFSRVISIAVDGTPGTNLLVSAGIEWAVGILAMFTLRGLRN